MTTELKTDGTPYRTSLAQREASHRYYHLGHGKEAARKFQETYIRSPKAIEKARIAKQIKRNKQIHKRQYIRYIRTTVPVLIILEQDASGVHAYCPELKGLHTKAAGIKQATINARRAAQAYIESLIKHGEPIPTKVN